MEKEKMEEEIKKKEEKRKKKREKLQKKNVDDVIDLLFKSEDDNEFFRKFVAELKSEVRDLNKQIETLTTERVKQLEVEKKKLNSKLKDFEKNQKVSFFKQRKLEEQVRKLQSEKTSKEREIKSIKVARIQSIRFESQRGKILKEFYFTEKTYITNLLMLKDSYVNPISTKSLIAKKLFDQIFKDLDMILYINRKFLKKLEEILFLRYRDEALVILVLEFSDSFKLYANYIKRYQHIHDLFVDEIKNNKKLAKFLIETEKEIRRATTDSSSDLAAGGTQEMTIQSLMIMPIQRIPRYLLLMKDMKKYTKKDKEKSDKFAQGIKTITDILKFCEKEAEEYKHEVTLEEVGKMIGMKLNPVKKFVFRSKSSDIQVIFKGKQTGLAMLFLFEDEIILKFQKKWAKTKKIIIPIFKEETTLDITDLKEKKEIKLKHISLEEGDGEITLKIEEEIVSKKVIDTVQKALKK